MANKRRIIIPIVAAGLVAGMGVTGAGLAAYLTDAETTENKFLVGKVKIDLEEPNYPGNGSDEVTNIVPNEEIRKDPLVENTGENNLVSFLKVYSPIGLVRTVNDDGTAKDAFGPHEIFYMKDAEDAITLHANHFSEDWPRLEAKEDAFVQAQDQEDGSVKYEVIDGAAAKAALWKAKFFHAVPQADGSVIMASIAVKDIAGLPESEKVYTITEADYNDVKASNPGFKFAANDAKKKKFVAVARTGEGDTVAKRLKDARIFKSYVFGYKNQIVPKQKTDSIFDKVQLANIVEGEIDTREQEIVIQTYAIQSENILAENSSIDTTGDITTENLGKIYQIFINQGTAGKGDEAQGDLYKNVEGQDANITPSKDLNGNMADATTKRIEISIAKAKIGIGKSEAITPTASTNGVKEETPTGITYTSDNPAIATVDDNGNVTGVALGSTFINATWKGATAKVEVTVVNPMPETTVDPTPVDPTPNP